MDYLEFEQPIAELEAKIEELRRVGSDSELNLSEEIGKLQTKCDSLSESIFAKLTPWQVAQLARHPQRPYTLDYVGELITDFNELYGDRLYSNDAAVISGIGRFEGTSVAIIGHQKGRSTNENLKRNFGMPRPEGYRKALRIMEMAEKFCMPIFTFIDTPGAYPGVGAEERGQSLAIARNLYRMSQLKTPIICTVIGEGGSGGALAIGVGDHLAMLSYSTYSVISPEGCASILWKSADKAQEAAEAMGITSDRLLELGLIDEIVQEPRRGAHHDFAATAENLRKMLSTNLSRLSKYDTSDLVQQRFKRLTSYGVYK